MTEFNRKERDHLEVLDRRRQWLRESAERFHRPGQRPEGFTEEAGFFAGEANALTWALSVIEGSVEPMEVRIERAERRLRQVEAQLGRIASMLKEEGEEL